MIDKKSSSSSKETKIEKIIGTLMSAEYGLSDGIIQKM